LTEKEKEKIEVANFGLGKIEKVGPSAGGTC